MKSSVVAYMLLKYEIVATSCLYVLADCAFYKHLVADLVQNPKYIGSAGEYISAWTSLASSKHLKIRWINDTTVRLYLK